MAYEMAAILSWPHFAHSEWWHVNIGSDTIFVPSGTTPAFLINSRPDLLRRMASLCHNELKRAHNVACDFTQADIIDNWWFVWEKKVVMDGYRDWPLWLILGLRPANERRRYKVTPSLIGWAQT